MRDFIFNGAPIDFNWQYTKTVEQTVIDIVKNDEEGSITLSQFLVAWLHAENEFRRVGYDGCSRELQSYLTQKKIWRDNDQYFPDVKAPIIATRVFWVPNPDNGAFECGFAVKQENNGTTFVVYKSKSTMDNL